ncbi:uncharacterized protein LOC142324108 [Lycorma delicatula]|uniref:uncharacterized protein LOC142324108 n=1 Tax=Lycorma delicatula TaxID=130591 RepID=UPI003F519FF6
MVTNTEDDDDSQEDAINYKVQYRNLKRKLKFLIYENECFQETLRSTQRRLLKASRDRSFLLDRLLALDKVEGSSSEGEETESSDDGEVLRSDAKRKKLDFGSHSYTALINSGSSSKTSSVKKRKPVVPKVSKTQNSSIQQPQPVQTVVASSVIGDSHVLSDEVERHLDSRHRYMDVDKAPATVPPEMFSNEPSLDSESNEICEMEASPSNIGDDCLSVDMIPE